MKELIQRCKITEDSFLVTEAEQSLLRRVGLANPVIGEALPIPDIKPAEILRRVFSFGNLTNLYRTTSLLSGSSQISRFYPADNWKVATANEFWSDAVDNRAAGMDYDFSRPFFVQDPRVLRRTTFLALSSVNSENCDFVSGSLNCKNCYLCFSATESQDCLYYQNVYYCNNDLGCVGIWHSSYCYACRDLDNCYECQECSDCSTCRQLYFCTDCRNCRNCIGSVGLDNGEFVAFNQQLDKRSYEQFLESAGLNSRAGRGVLRRRAVDLAKSLNNIPRRSIGSENCTGAYIRRSKNCHQSFHVEESEDCGYCIIGSKARDGWKGYCYGSELTYASGVLGAYGAAYSYWVAGGESNAYCYYVFNGCSHCFGCANLKKSSYCLLNKQLTKEEYFEIVPRVIKQMKQTGEWGQFFPLSCCPHYYNESFASDYIETLPADELARRGYRNIELASPVEQANQIEGTSLPDLASAADQLALLNHAVRCAESGHFFNFQRAELEFYNQYNIPLPQTHWRNRLRQMVDQRQKMEDNVDVVR